MSKKVILTQDDIKALNHAISIAIDESLDTPLMSTIILSEINHFKKEEIDTLKYAISIAEDESLDTPAMLEAYEKLMI